MVAFDNSLGALLIGVIAAAILYGFACLQTWYYCTHYFSDPWYIKLLVAAVLISESISQVMITHAAYTYVIINFGVLDNLGKIVWSLVAAVFSNVITVFLVQCFFATRVYSLSNKSRVIISIIMALSTAGFVAGFTFGVKASGLDTFVQMGDSLGDLSMTINVLSTSTDLLIAVILCYLLQISRTGFRRSDTLITKLIVFSINTSLLTSFCAIAALVSVTVWPGTWIYIPFFFCIGRLYFNSLLATLNARKQLRSISVEEDVSLHSRSAQQRASQNKVGTSAKRVPNNISIKIDTAQEYIRDEYSPNGDSDAKSPEAV